LIGGVAAFGSASLSKRWRVQTVVVIISHQHKFIFIKTRKTAGTSIELALSLWCGERDVVTPISPEDEVTRRASTMGVRHPQNFKVPVFRCGAGDFRTLATTRRLPRFKNHTPARDVRRRVARSVWDNYLVFAVERNPFDRLISLYHWDFRHESSRPTMAEYLAGLPDRIVSNWSVYAVDDEIIVDEVVTYEDLTGGLNTIASRLGIDIDVSGLTAKASVRSDRRPYWEVLDNETREIIETRCAREIEHFGYTWGSGVHSRP
jgi:hypothetical protein